MRGVASSHCGISIVNPSHETVRESLLPLIAAGHDRLAGHVADALVPAFKDR